MAGEGQWPGHTENGRGVGLRKEHLGSGPAVFLQRKKLCPWVPVRAVDTDSGNKEAEAPQGGHNEVSVLGGAQALTAWGS